MTAKPRSPDGVEKVVRWYFGTAPRQPVPFYCDPRRVGGFAVPRRELASGSEAALFKLFVALSMYQALRDVVIMRRQLSLPAHLVRVVADMDFVETSVRRHRCPALRSVAAFEAGCDVGKSDTKVDCGKCAGIPCHVKTATVVFNRMGDMGKLPTSAWLRFWSSGLQEALDEVSRHDRSPAERAKLLVHRFAQVHRVGRKLATMFVSALSTPALAPGLTPWFPTIDGNDLVVVDTNVARAVDALRGPRARQSYGAREQWLRDRAQTLDLRKVRADLPAYSPRLVQEALYAFCSSSNRTANGDPCVGRIRACPDCVPALCPYVSGRQSGTSRR